MLLAIPGKRLHTSQTTPFTSNSSRYMIEDDTTALFDSDETEVTSTKMKARSTATKWSGKQKNIVTTS